MLLVDTHTHVSPYWYEPVETLLYQMATNGVDKAVLVQLGVGRTYDNSYLVECIRRFPGRFSAVAIVDTDKPDATEQLEEWVKQGVEGIRLRGTLRSPGQDPLIIWRKAAETRIVVSAVGVLKEFASLEFENVINEFPNLNFIIEHLGHGGDDTAPYETYRRVLALAKYTNVFMKVPGLGEISKPSVPFHTSTYENVPPLIEMAVEAFGARRLMWGSDFPRVSGDLDGYRNALRLPMEHVQFKSQEDKEWIFGRTATTLFQFR